MYIAVLFANKNKKKRLVILYLWRKNTLWKKWKQLERLSLFNFGNLLKSMDQGIEGSY